MPKGTIVNRGITPALMRHFSLHPGEILFVKDIATATNYSEEICRKIIANIISGNKLPGVEVVARGNAWRYSPNSAPKVKAAPSEAPAPARPKATTSKRVFQEIGSTKDGAIIIESEEGKLYKAEEL